MYGALLSEVWPDMSPRISKKKKKKREKLVTPQPLTPEEMDQELLRENYEETSISKKLAGMRVSPYTDSNTLYEYPTRYTNNTSKQSREFLESGENNRKPEYNYPRYNYPMYTSSSTPEEQMNELLLYIFTGLFFIFIYDNLYKLGKNI